MPANGGTGFEDIGISADGQLVLLTGRTTESTDLLVAIRAPFTTAGATSFTIPILNVANPGRGAGAVRFLPAGLAPGLTISKSAAATVASGSDLTYTLTYANTGSVNASSVIIRDPLPAGTTFVSATNGGTVSGGSVVFNIGAVNGNTASQTVSFTVRVTAAQGATVTNSGYTIEANGVAPIPGPPVTTTVTADGVSQPVANPDNVTVTQNSGATAINVRANDTDPNGLPLIVTSAGPASNGTVTFNNGQVFYTPNAGFSGSDSFQYSISNGNGGTATGTVFVTVNAVPAGRRVFGQGTVNTQGNRRGVFSFDATTIGSGPQATGTFSFSRPGGPFIVFNAPVENLVVNSAGTSATFSGAYIRNGRTGAPIATYVVTVTHTVGSTDTFSIQTYRANSSTPFYSFSGYLTSGFVSIFQSQNQAS